MGRGAGIRIQCTFLKVKKKMAMPELPRTTEKREMNVALPMRDYGAMCF